MVLLTDVGFMTLDEAPVGQKLQADNPMHLRAVLVRKQQHEQIIEVLSAATTCKYVNFNSGRDNSCCRAPSRLSSECV